MLKHWLNQLTSIGRDRTKQNDLDREFSFHVEMETAALVEAGVPEEEARRRALVSFGGVDRYQEEMRDGWMRRSVTDLTSDIRYALRGLRRTPAFTLTAVATLAIGLGGAAAVFTAIDGVLLAPLPYANEDRIVRIFQQNATTDRWSLSVADFQGIQWWQRSFDAAVVVQFGEVALSGGDEPVWVRAGRATQGLFATFGVGVARGRTFSAADTMPNASPVVVISDALARKHFGSANAVDRAIVLDRESYTVIGVLAPDQTTLGGIRADVWPLARLQAPERRGPFGLMGFAVMRPGVTLDAAATDLADISKRLFPMWTPNFSDKTAILTPFPLREVLLGDASKSLGILFGAVALVLLIALANVTNLVLVRSSARQRELALRLALGAGRSRLTRLMLTENIVLSMMGGALAIVVATAALAVLKAIGPTMPRLDTVTLEPRTILLTLLLALACGIAIAAYPMAFSSTRGIAHSLRGSDRRSSSGRGTRALQSSLVIAEFALALPLLAGAALLMHSFMKLQRVDTGIDPTNVIAIRVSLPSSQYEDGVLRSQFWNDALREVGTVPGVTSAGITSSLPPDNQGDTNNFNLVDRPVAEGTSEPQSPWSSIMADYFPSLQASLLSGRAFNEHDNADAPPVLIVSRNWAERYFPNESPLGRQLVGGGCLECALSTIVGVVEDIKYSGLTGNGEGVYVPFDQWPRPTVYMVVRTSADPRALLAQIRARVHAVDPHLPLDDVELMADRLADAIAEPRHWTLLVGGFAAIAVLLAALGVFGVMSYVVSQQQRDIGVRLALGAAPASVVALILKRGLTLAFAGTAIGVFVAIQGTRALEHVLYDVTATNPVTLAAVATVLLAFAALACYLPGRRAAAVDPVRVMTAE